ncbi:5,10-methylenetetrahydrofolate reductase [Ruaniaceae bacterium KH17]|nr:5,10-methylenetetrahydrofolate reductase [Ruaniaceae bacterium KH17]
MDVVQSVREGRGGFLLFGITPPKAATPPDRLSQITEANLDRLRAANADGIALYDIAEEQDRNPDARPFPFLPTHDPGEYLAHHLRDWHKSTVIYRAVGKYSEPELAQWLQNADADQVMTVLVGASSSSNQGSTSLRRAYELRQELRPDLVTGAILIPERHTNRGDEHLRMLGKQESGAQFFVSQILYDSNAAKDVLAAYADECEARGITPVPVVFTLSVCGSLKTLDFLEWLGVKVPGWMRRDLRRAESTLAASLELSRSIAVDMVQYGRRLGVPVGLNVESVSSRRVEIDAAVALSLVLRGTLAD